MRTGMQSCAWNMFQVSACEQTPGSGLRLQRALLTADLVQSARTQRDDGRCTDHYENVMLSASDRQGSLR